MINELGKTIRILRQAKDMKLNVLAEAAGLSVPFLSLVENGQRQPSLGVLRKIADGLGVPSEALVLMSMGPQTGLRSSDPTTIDITKSVNKLLELESRLHALLAESKGSDECDSDHSR